jgi:hypothetical protein
VAKNKVKAGRPTEVKFNPEVVSTMAAFGATKTHIAQHYNCTEKTVARYIKSQFKMNYVQLCEEKSKSIDRSLRHKQVDVALKGNVAMLIWLGKVRLDQRDRTEVVNTNLNYDNECSSDEIEELRKTLQIKDSFSPQETTLE